jgi:hypothetical protein
VGLVSQGRSPVVACHDVRSAMSRVSVECLSWPLFCLSPNKSNATHALLVGEAEKTWPAFFG